MNQKDQSNHGFQLFYHLETETIYIHLESEETIGKKEYKEKKSQEYKDKRVLEINQQEICMSSLKKWTQTQEVTEETTL